MVKSQDNKQTHVRRIDEPMNEYIAICPKCLTMETVYLVDGKLINTKKFRQIKTYVFHTCGAIEPCRLILNQ